MSHRVLKFILLILLAGSLILATVYILRKGTEVIRGAAREVVRKEETTVDLESIVTRVRDLSRLETAAMKVMNVSTIDQSYGVVPNSMAGDSLTFLGVGEVIAGVDLSQLRREDVRVAADGFLVVVLPPPQILITRLDNTQSRVMTRETGIFRKADVHLESRARAHAELNIKNEAIKKGILPLAQQNAQQKLADFIHTLGVKRVRFENRVVETNRL